MIFGDVLQGRFHGNVTQERRQTQEETAGAVSNVARVKEKVFNICIKKR